MTTRTADEAGRSDIFSVRGVPDDIQYRMKVQAALKRITIGALVSRILKTWLDGGALVEELSE